PARELARQVGGGGDGAARLGDQAPGEGEVADGGADLVLGDGDDVVHVRLKVGEGQLGELGAQPVGDGAEGTGGIPDDEAAGGEALGGVGGQLGLDPDDPDRRPRGLDGGGDAGDEAAAADRHGDDLGVGQV